MLLLIHQFNYSFSVLTILARNFVFADVADFTNIALLCVTECASYLDQLVQGVTSVIAVNVVCNVDDTKSLTSIKEHPLVRWFRLHDRLQFVHHLLTGSHANCQFKYLGVFNGQGSIHFVEIYLQKITRVGDSEVKLQDP